MGQPITKISGPVSLFIYHYNHKKYFFFGDIHFTREGSCHSQGDVCDGFDFEFQNTNTKYTNCTTIGALLHHWFIYNNDHQIPTDFYIETAFNKGEYQIQDVEELQRRRTHPNYPKNYNYFKDHSWLELLDVIMAPCLVKNKSACPYSPNVHVHYSDVRNVRTAQGVIDILPFSISNIVDFLNRQKVDVMMENDVESWLFWLYLNAKMIIYNLLSPDGLSKLVNVLKLLTFHSGFKEFIQQQIKDLYLMSVERDGIKMFKAAWELERLRTVNLEIYESLWDFVDDEIDKQIAKFKKLYHSHPEGVDNMLDYYDNAFMNFEAIIMDVYLIARMFVQSDSDEIIVYAGNYHIKNYNLFFQHYLNTYPVLSIPYKEHVSCLSDERIPDYIPASMYRHHVLNS
jgi:hypothetical protein